MTLRIRHKDGDANDNNTITLKLPSDRQEKKSTKAQTARYEYEIKTVSTDKISNDDIEQLKYYVPDEYYEKFGSLTELALHSVRKIVNMRRKVKISTKLGDSLIEALFELVIDNIAYSNPADVSGKEINEQMIEVELKSEDYSHRFALKELTDLLDNSNDINKYLEHSIESKLDRADKLFISEDKSVDNKMTK
jgi:hypothetical protein